MPIANRSLLRRLVLTLGIVATSLVAAGPGTSSASSTGAGDGFAGSSGDAVRARSASTPLGVGPTTPGLDVSHWQGEIDWAKVDGAGKRFVFMKATDGRNYVDPTFATNRAGAKANGLLVGAYHFARPDPSFDDARREAQFFVDQVEPTAGELLPVLDIEVSGGLNQTEMTKWARRWVAKVRELTGITPLVYTSPYGWAQRFGDTQVIADIGAPLWVAHWGVSSPLVPADDWGGRGWVVWQHTSSGHVAGITGRVDLDRLAGTVLGTITVRRLSLAIDGDAGSVTTSPEDPGCRTACTRNMDPNATVTLTAIPDDHAYFTRWEGDCRGSDPTCTVTMRGARDVLAHFVTDITPPTPTLAVPAGFSGPAVVHFDEMVRGVSPRNVVLREAGGAKVQVARTCRSIQRIVPCTHRNIRSIALVPRRPWVPGRNYAVTVDPAGVSPRVKDRIGNAALTIALDFEGPPGVEENRVPAVYAWGSVPSDAAFGGSYAVERRAGASFSFRFGGPSVTWNAATGPAYGKAQVRIDGRARRVVDLWAPRRTLKVAHVFANLGGGPHTITVRVLGLRRPGATDRLVAVDAFRTHAGLVATPTGRASWQSVTAGTASGGKFSMTDSAGAAVTLRFGGTGVDWTTVTGPDRGRARIYVDGVLLRTVDLYAVARTFGVVETIDGLADGPHVLRIVATGWSRPAATGALVAVDRFDVR